jgi:hypothetical protein
VSHINCLRNALIRVLVLCRLYCALQCKYFITGLREFNEECIPPFPLLHRLLMHCKPWPLFTGCPVTDAVNSRRVRSVQLIVFSPDSPATRSKRSIGSGGESSSMLTSVEGNAVQAFCTRKTDSN